jgi:putative ubiquitin-RnfH superfamily antitoxin RatB of RatAB toxin-antitoxin module
VTSKICVETVVQCPQQGGLPLLQQQHRIPSGTTIRQLLHQVAAAGIVDAIESGNLGLAVYGKRAWLDDILVDGWRVEVVAPIEADAKAARVARAAADRSRRQRTPVSSVR